MSTPANLITFLSLILLTMNLSYAGKVEMPLTIDGATKVDAEQLIQTLEKFVELIIVDSRIIEDRQQGYIPDSISLSNEETDCKSLSVLLKELSSPVLFYCNSPKCSRSFKAVNIARQCGYLRIFWFRGGFDEWTKKQYPFSTINP